MKTSASIIPSGVFSRVTRDPMGGEVEIIYWTLKSYFMMIYLVSIECFHSCLVLLSFFFMDSLPTPQNKLYCYHLVD